MNAQIQHRRGTDPKTEDERIALSKEALKHAFLDNLFYVQGKFPALATKHDYYMALAYAVRDRMLQRWISTAERLHQAGLAHGRLPVGRVPDGSAPGQQPDQSRHLRRSAPGGRRTRPGLRRAARAGGGAGPRQRRPRPAGRLLSRFAGDAGDPLARLRHPLRVRHLPAGDRRRLAGREDRQVAALRQPWEVPRPGVGGRGEARRPHRALHRRARARCACAGCRTRS